MTELIENIANNCFGTDLRKTIFELKGKYSNSQEIDVFINLFGQTVRDNLEIENNELLNDFSSIGLIKNIEISGRWHEYISYRFPKKKPEHLRKAVFYYLEIFTTTKNNTYLIHSLRLVKTAKGLFTNEIERIYETGKSEVLRLDTPFCQKEIIIQLFSLCPEQTKIDFGGFLKDEIKKQNERHDYSGVFWLIESLKKIKVISITDSKILHAENFENKGDYLSNDKNPNDYYPTILDTYQKGLRELKSIKSNEDLRIRLECKVLKEQKENIKMFSALSQSNLETNDSVNKQINDFGDLCIDHYKVFDFESGFQGLISFPISLEVNFETEKIDNFLYLQMLNSAVRIDSKGKTVGITNIENFHEIEKKRIFRESVINFLRKTKWKMDEDKILNKDSVFYYIQKKCSSKFIPADRKLLFANGIYHGFNNDYITSAHILIPQLENSLKYILDYQGILTFKIYDEKQHDNMLGGILDIFINKTKHDVFYELKDFLLENSSINFRNKLCHGLLSPFEIEHYGIYVWWLTLKLIFDKENIFELLSKKL